MKKILSKITINYTILSAFAFLFLTSGTMIPNPDPLLLFKKVSHRLSSLKSVKYTYKREFNYPSENYLSKSQGDMYVEFSPNYDLAGYRYQYSYDGGLSIFNDSEVFTAESKTKKLHISYNLKPQQLEGKSSLYNSIPTLRNILPVIIQDNNIPKAQRDTTIEKRSYHMLEFTLENKLLNYSGSGFSKTTLPFTFHYKLIVDKISILPVTLLQIRKGSQDLNRTDFENINLKPTAPVEKTWYYSSYLSDYQIEQDKPVSMIAVGQDAPEWKLTNYTNNATESLAMQKGKVTLLEFWIRHCGYCIEAVKKLNLLNDKYKDKNFELLAVNTEASRDDIKQFAAKHPMNYTVLFGNKSDINKDYGIYGFPLIVLIDKNGKVIYSGGLEIDKITEIIDKNI